MHESFHLSSSAISDTFYPKILNKPGFCRAHRGGGRLRDPNCVRLSVVRPSVRDAYKNLNNFAATGLFKAKRGWELLLENPHDYDVVKRHVSRSKVK